MKRNNILIILPYWDSTFRNKNIGKLLKRLNSNDQNLYLYCSPSEGDKDLVDFIPSIKLFNSRPVTEKGIFKRLVSIIKFINILFKIKKVRVFWTYAGYIENIALSLLRVPFVLKSDSSLELAKDKKNIFSKFRAYLFYKYVGKHASLILVETKQLLKKSYQVYNQEKVLYFPNGVDMEQFLRFKSSKKSNIHKEKKRFLCTGRMIHSKGIDLAIKSFALISKDIDWELHFVGSSEDQIYLDECKSLIDKNDLAERVFFHDVCFGDDLFLMYEEGDIFIMPSRNEGLANRLPEAMIFGNPVIAYDVGYTNELVSMETGAIIEPENYIMFSEEMKKMAINDELRNSISTYNTQLIRNNYNDEILFHELFEATKKSKLFH